MAMFNVAVGLCIWEQAAATRVGKSLPQDGQAGKETTAEAQMTQDAFLITPHKHLLHLQDRWPQSPKLHLQRWLYFNGSQGCSSVHATFCNPLGFTDWQRCKESSISKPDALPFAEGAIPWTSSFRIKGIWGPFKASGFPFIYVKPLVTIFLLTFPGILVFTVHLLFFQHPLTSRMLWLWHHLLILLRLANTSALQRLHSLDQMMQYISARPRFQASLSQLINCTPRDSKQAVTQGQGEKG